MKYSKLFPKTEKVATADASNQSYKLLYRGGFIRESSAGRYYFLPLGIRVQQKMVALIKKHMDGAGAQEMITPVLHPLGLWKETNRTNSAGFELMTIDDRHGASFALGGTAEEMFVDLIRKFQLSYKDLPLNLYQFSSKFRDELRVRGGLLRVREFMMKDGYSFHRDQADFEKEYKSMWEAYLTIYQAMGLSPVVVKADNGYIGGEYCHEFIVESEVGESKFLTTEDGSYCEHEDVATFARDEINMNEEEKPFEIFEQPTWVQTMDDNAKHYNLPKSRFLKNVVYKNRVSGEIIIAVMRGDLEVNKTKLEQVLDAVGQLEDATIDDLTSIGTKPGYVHCWGHEGVRYIGDLSLTSVKNFIGGQKEDTTDSRNVNYGRDFTCELLADIALAKEGYMTEDGKQLMLKKGIEVGNIFQLGYHYTRLMAGANFIDENGKEQQYYMGCYGFGIGRTLATVVEIHHDDRGIIWPESIAPYQVHLIGLNLEDEEVKSRVEKVYQDLIERDIEVLFDDRPDISAGEKFADADLIGIPYRLVVSKKTGEQIEVKKRSESESMKISFSELLTLLA